MELLHNKLKDYLWVIWECSKNFLFDRFPWNNNILGNNEGAMANFHSLCLKLKVTINIYKGLNILTLSQNELHLPLGKI